MSKEIKNMENLMEQKDVQFRDFQLTKIETRKVEEEEKEELVIEGMPITFDSRTHLFDIGENKYFETIDKNALVGADLSDVIFNYNHGGRVYARTRNKTLELEPCDDGIKMRATLWPDDPGHLALYKDIKRGNVDKMSFAFTVEEDDWSFDEDAREYDRQIKKINRVFDVSAVDIPAYDSTSISARRAFDAESERREAESKKAESLDLMNERKFELKRRIMKELI